MLVVLLLYAVIVERRIKERTLYWMFFVYVLLGRTFVFGLRSSYKKRKNPLKTLKTFKTPKNLKPKNLFLNLGVFTALLCVCFTRRLLTVVYSLAQHSTCRFLLTHMLQLLLILRGQGQSVSF